MTWPATIANKQNLALAAGICTVIFSWLRWGFTGAFTIDANPLTTPQALLALVAVGIPMAVFWRLQSTENFSSVSYACLLIAAFLFMPPFLSNDIFSVWAYGQAYLLGFDPYSIENGIAQTGFSDEVSFIYKTTPCVYGPVPLYISSLSVSLAGDSVLANLFVTKFILLFLVAGCGVFSIKVSSAGDRWAVMAVLLHPLALVEGMGQAHTDIIGLCFILPALLCWKNAKCFPCIPVLLALAISVKITFVFLLPLLVLSWNEGQGIRFQPARRLLAGLGLFVAAFLLVHAPFLPELNSFLAPFKTVTQLRPSSTWQDMFGELAGIVWGEETRDTVWNYTGMLNVILSASLAAWVGFTVLRSRNTAGIVAWGLLAGGTVLICFYSHRFFSWYLIGLLPMIYLFLPADNPWLKWISVLGFFSTVQSFSHLAPRDSLFFQIIVVVTTLACVILQWLYFRQRFLLKRNLLPTDN